MADSSDFYDIAYPDLLRNHEKVLLKTRREAVEGTPSPEMVPADTVGVALSGGGIRSATFSLGFFQSLARWRLLRRVDYLSTVSGGGYFGAFLGRLFTRDFISKPEDVEQVLQGETTTHPDVLRALRENGRYLSPNGAGDLLLGGAALLRNWVAIQVVLAFLFLTLFLLADVIIWLAHVVGEALPSWDPGALSAMGYLSTTVHLSAWFVPTGVLLFLVVIPLGWAYWIVERGLVPQLWAFAGLFLFIVLSVFVALNHHMVVGTCCAIVGISVLMWRVLCAVWTCRTPELARDHYRRNLLSKWLRDGLVVSFALLVFALIDTAGQTIYQKILHDEASMLLSWGTGLMSTLLGLAAFGRKIAILFDGKVSGKRPSLSVSVIATSVALLLVTIVLIGLNVLSHFISWNTGGGKDPSSPRLNAIPVAAPEEILRPPRDGAQNVDGPAAEKAIAPLGRGQHPTSQNLPAPIAALGVCILFSVLFGRTFPFLNRSSHQSLYSARLTRAYLGASNLNRLKPKKKKNVALSDVVDGDDIQLEQYWSRGEARLEHAGKSGHGANGGKTGSSEGFSAPFEKGAPLHLINVTINETVDGKSQIQQQDRKGTGLALGPGGMSVGVKHHAVFDWTERKAQPATPSDASSWTSPDKCATYLPPERNVFEGFSGEEQNRKWQDFEKLPLGAWVSISGAAFSTGLGARTNLGLSLLCGMGNVRLGYWWYSGIRGRSRRSILSLPRILFPVQGHLLSEFVSRFPGTAQPRWYLSDGGHFENMGAYELIRRRIRFMCIVDAEADPDYTFEGLGNLVRKARLDFKAEIHFLTEEELTKTVHPSYREYFGTLEQLRRGKWTTAPAKDGQTPETQEVLEASDETRFSRAHAALAWVDYEGDKDTSLLLYVKPSLTGDEPSDVIRYHSEHSSFPQESTIDQFFDEAQWESYRKLGEHIGEVLFSAARAGKDEVPPEPEKAAPQWKPCDLFQRRPLPRPPGDH